MILKYPGGQHYMTNEIVRMMLPHRTYVEPFFGSGKVFFKKMTMPALVANFNVLSDLNKDIVNFWECVRDHYIPLQKGLNAIPYCKEAFEIWKESGDAHRIVLAMKTFVLSRMSRSGMGSHFSDSTRLRRSMDEGESAWKTALGEIPKASAMLQDSSLTIQDALGVILTNCQDPRTLIYLDPPYYDVKNLYKHDVDHEEMLKIICEAPCKVILSGYDSPLYRRYLGAWFLNKFDKKNRMSQGDELPTVSQCVWRNYL